MKIKTIDIFNPFFMIPTIFVMQFLIWYIFMPDNSYLEGVKPKEHNFLSIFRFLILMISMVTGFFFAKILLKKENLFQIKTRVNTNFYIIINIICFFIFLIGEFFYLKSALNLISSINIQSLLNEGISVYAKEVINNRIIGLSSLNNIFIIPLAISSLLLFSKEPSNKIRYFSIFVILFIGAVTLFHALFLAGRMFFIYYVVVISCCHALFKPKKIKISSIIIVLLTLILIVIFAEFFRYGIIFSQRNGVALFSTDTLLAIIEYISIAYISNDVNNTMIALANDSSLQLVSSSPVLKGVLSLIGINNFMDIFSFNHLPRGHGTVNFLGLIWFDFGWAGIAVGFLVGFFCQYYYIKACSSSAIISTDILIFVTISPALYSISRINYFGQTIFLLPFILIVLIRALLIRKVKVHHHNVILTKRINHRVESV
ncbi:hypothetical protein C0966_12765 [Bacillus methanolicus]|uniref:O-antigen polymerase n=1 Tax=Bacillus methanolicus TaxID=1471 RepID=UPI002380598D|nr:O-antigen polymerase [Bacillus methanolicus]MDE3840216.1 hypothetical protein [Bacillus methanolicus]